MPVSRVSVRGGRAVVIGASFVEQGGFVHLQGLVGGRRLFYQKGVGGETSAQIAARLQTDVLDLDPLLVIIDAGMNDVIDDISVSTIQTNLTGMYEDCEDAGIEVCTCTMQVFGTSGTYTASRNTARLQMNDWIKAQPYPYLDYDVAVGDNSTPIAVKAEYDNGDHLHLNAAGDRAVSATAFQQLFGSRPL